MKFPKSTKELRFSILLSILIAVSILFIANAVFADSCPYCGREYPDPMPGDEARVYELRRQHEEKCRLLHEQQGSYDSSSGYSGGGYSGPEPSTDYGHESVLMQRKQKVIEEQRRLRLQEQQEKEARQIEEEKIRRQEFRENKQRLLNSLKGTSPPSLKTQAANSQKGLKIKEVPSPLPLKSTAPQQDVSLKSVGSQPTGDSGIVKKAMVESYKKTKQDMIDKIKEKMLEESLKPFPGATYAKSLYDRYKEMRQEMESLNLNIFQYAMMGIKEGVKKSASPSLSDGGLSEEYEGGRESLFGNTVIKTRNWLKKEIEK